MVTNSTQFIMIFNIQEFSLSVCSNNFILPLKSIGPHVSNFIFTGKGSYIVNPQVGFKIKVFCTCFLAQLLYIFRIDETNPKTKKVHIKINGQFIDKRIYELSELCEKVLQYLCPETDIGPSFWLSVGLLRNLGYPRMGTFLK